MSKPIFKVGDKLRCLVNRPSCAPIKPDEIVKVIQSDSDGITVKAKDGRTWLQNHNPTEFVLVESADHKKQKREKTMAHPKDAGSKADDGKIKIELIPVEFLIETAKALTFGAGKYGPHNFRKGLSASRLLGAAKRHIELELAGVKADSESGHSHLAHAAASLAMYSFMKAHRPELDDRYVYTEEELKKVEEMMYGKK